MPAYQTPGVYFERVDASAPAISAIRTDVAGFVGIAPRGPVDIPVPVQSWRQYQAYFGGFSGAGFLAYTVRGFFENGGQRCWIVRVASRDPVGGATAAATVLQSPSGSDVWRIVAFSPGVWGNSLTVSLQETHTSQAFTDPQQSTSRYSVVNAIGGFSRRTLVRLTQDSRPPAWKVVSDVDPVKRYLIWVHDNPRLRLPYDSPLTEFDQSRPVFVESVEYTLIVREAGNLIALYQGLSLVPGHENYGPDVLAPVELLRRRKPTAPADPDVLAPVELFADALVRGRFPAAPRPIVIEESPPGVAIEPIYPGTVVALRAVIDPTHVRLASIAGTKPGAVLELLDPRASGAAVGGPLRVESIDPTSGDTITLAGPGLSAEQAAAYRTADVAGTHLNVGARWRTRSLEGGTDGLALLRVYDFIGEEISPSDSDTLKDQKRRGIRVLESVDEVSVVAVPDIHIQPVLSRDKAPSQIGPDPCLLDTTVQPATPTPPAETEVPPVFSEDDVYTVQAALVQHCEDRRDRIALLDPPFSAAKDDELGINAIRALRSRFDSKYAALYYPWLRVVDPLHPASAITRDIPPSGHVAGRYASNDLTVGVHKAPANAPLMWIQDVTVYVDDAVHGLLNDINTNVIRPLSGRGIRVMGARTVSSDPDWRYVNVRRLLMMIEKAVYLSTQWAAFEPNDVYTRAKLRLSLTSFLVALWQQGALMGTSADEAFFVKCDGENNPAPERDKGKLLAEVGVAPSKPFEFVVLRIGRTDNEFEISELALRTGGA